MPNLKYYFFFKIWKNILKIIRKNTKYTWKLLRYNNKETGEEKIEARINRKYRK